MAYDQYKRVNQKQNNSKKPISSVKKGGKKNSSVNSAHRIGAICFIILAIYLFGYVVTALSKTKTNIEIVKLGTIGTPEEYSGIIVREEKIYNSDKEGIAEFFYGDKDFVQKGTVVCSIKNAVNSAVMEKELAFLDSDIFSKQQDRMDISIFSEDIAKSNKKIKSILDDNAPKISKGNIGIVYDIKSRITKEMAIRNQMILNDSESSIKQLVDEKNIFEKQLVENTKLLAADNAGILSFDIDNFEGIFTKETLQFVSEEQTKMDIPVSYKGSISNVNSDEPMFKIVSSNMWYICSYIPNESAEDLKAGGTANIYLDSNNTNKLIEMDIYFVEKGDKATYVVFKSNQFMTEFLNTRNVKFKLNNSQFEGIKIPNSAIIEKTLYKVPINYIIESQGINNILKKSEHGYDMHYVRVSYSDREFAYILQDFDTIKINDKIYYKDENEQYSEYEVNEINSAEGVYVVNSGTADFKQITILNQNDYYTIVQGNSAYGLKQYDRIITDAKTITDDQIIN